MTIATSQQITPEAATSPWNGFRTGLWRKEINVRDFIQQTASHTGEVSPSLRPRRNGLQKYKIV